jgi:hypothetical protein
MASKAGLGIALGKSAVRGTRSASHQQGECFTLPGVAAGGEKRPAEEKEGGRRPRRRQRFTSPGDAPEGSEARAVPFLKARNASR